MELIVYDINDILENTLLHADSNVSCSSSGVGDYIGQCMDFIIQADGSGNGDTGGGGGGEVENPCSSVSIAECHNWAMCGLITLLR